jgi:hypothetical protein
MWAAICRMVNTNVQLESLGGEDYVMTQLWRAQSSDLHPKTLFAKFPTVEQRVQFAKLAKHLGIDDGELGLALVRDFMDKHPGRFLSD